MTAVEMSEAQLQALVMDTAELGGWLVYHVARSDTGQVTSKGFPDLVMVRGPDLLFVELKSAKGRVSADQEAWLEALGNVDYITAEVVRPANVDDLIKRLLLRR